MIDSKKEEVMNKFKHRIHGLSNLQINLNSFFYQQTNLHFLKCCMSIEIDTDDERNKDNKYKNHIFSEQYFKVSYSNIFIAECLFPVRMKTQMNDSFYIGLKKFVDTIVLYKNLWNFDNTDSKKRIERAIECFSYYNESKTYNRVKRRINHYMTIKFETNLVKNIYNIHNKPALYNGKQEYRNWTIVNVKKNFMFDKFLVKYFNQDTIERIKNWKSKKVVKKRSEKNWRYGY